MSSRLARLPLRVRLVAGFSAAMLVVLTAAGAFVYWRVEYALDRGLDGELRAATEVIAPAVGADGRVTERATADATGTGWQVLSADGTILDAGGPVPAAPLVPVAGLDGLAGTDHRTVDVGSLLPVSAQPSRVRVTALDRAGPAAYLLVGVRRDRRDEALRELLLQLTLASLSTLVVASLVGDRLARAALRPVERYRRQAAEIADGATRVRLDVPPDRDDEVTRLGHTLNEMLATLEQALDRERRFVDDAGHELRTPLTLLRSRIQLTRRRTRSVAEHEQVLAELEVDVARLVDLAEDLLAPGRRPPDPGIAASGTDAGTALAAVLARRRVARPGPEVRVDVPEEPVVAAVAGQVLERIVTNLLDNADVHGRPPVSVALRRAQEYVVLEVVDSGEGMPAPLLAQATERFHRAVEARSRPGSGLGLSIVAELVAAAGGELRLCHAGTHHATGDPSPIMCAHGAAMTVTVLLPAADAPGVHAP